MGLCMYCGKDDHAHEQCTSDSRIHPRGSVNPSHLYWITHWGQPLFHVTKAAYDRTRGEGLPEYDEYMFDLLRDEKIEIFRYMSNYRSCPESMNVIYTREYQRYENGETTGSTRRRRDFHNSPWKWNQHYSWAKHNALAPDGTMGIFDYLDREADKKRGKGHGKGAYTNQILGHVPVLDSTGMLTSKGKGKQHGKGPYDYPSKGKGKGAKHG